MAKKLKVYGGTSFVSVEGLRRQRRVVCFAHSKAHALRVLDKALGGKRSLGYFNTYWSETGNSEELALATYPSVWASTNPVDRTYVEIYREED